ncbi:hypothetical protein ACIQC0_01755 [Pseudarthrobacter sp. NPDC092419]|uniref:hypothetical protein n=1 Tax=Pseudarthrobacter sp. NPDC092419 TaxID=3364414 RepID=UPI0038292CBD
MNTPPEPGAPLRSKPPLSDAAKASLATTHTLFRIFVPTVLGAFFVYQLDVSHLWLTALLTAAGLVLGVVLLIRWARLKDSRLVLVGTISGLVVSVLMVLIILVSAVFFEPVRAYQDCSRQALTEQALSACRVQLERSLPTQLR